MSLNTYNENVEKYDIIASYPKSRYMVSENDQFLQIWRKTHWNIHVW